MNESNPWLAYVRPNPQARLRLFCFHYAGGSAALFRAWQRQLPEAVEVCPVQLPGRENRITDPPLTRLRDVVEAVAVVLRPVLERPYALFGHSMGALVAFELARRLREVGAPGPARLFVSGCRAPQEAGSQPPTYQLPDDQFIAELRRLNGTPAAVFEHAELLQLLLPVLRADFEAVQTYRYATAPPLACPITAFGGKADDHVNCEQLAAWGQQTTTDFKLELLPGDHFFLNTAQPRLLQLVNEELQGWPARGLKNGT